MTKSAVPSRGTQRTLTMRASCPSLLRAGLLRMFYHGENALRTSRELTRFLQRENGITDPEGKAVRGQTTRP